MSTIHAWHNYALVKKHSQRKGFVLNTMDLIFYLFSAYKTLWRKFISANWIENIGVLKHLYISDSPEDLPRTLATWPSSDFLSQVLKSVLTIYFSRKFSAAPVYRCFLKSHKSNSFTDSSFSVACGQALPLTDILTVGVTQGSLETCHSKQQSGWNCMPDGLGTYQVSHHLIQICSPVWCERIF